MWANRLGYLKVGQMPNLNNLNVICSSFLIPIVCEVALNQGLKPLALQGLINCKLKLNWYKQVSKAIL
jgi:hypothetical protein